MKHKIESNSSASKTKRKCLKANKRCNKSSTKLLTLCKEKSLKEETGNIRFQTLSCLKIPESIPHYLGSCDSSDESNHSPIDLDQSSHGSYFKEFSEDELTALVDDSAHIVLKQYSLENILQFNIIEEFLCEKLSPGSGVKYHANEMKSKTWKKEIVGQIKNFTSFYFNQHIKRPFSFKKSFLPNIWTLLPKHDLLKVKNTDYLTYDDFSHNGRYIQWAIENLSESCSQIDVIVHFVLASLLSLIEHAALNKCKPRRYKCASTQTEISVLECDILGDLETKQNCHSCEFSQPKCAVNFEQNLVDCDKMCTNSSSKTSFHETVEIKSNYNVPGNSSVSGELGRNLEAKYNCQSCEISQSKCTVISEQNLLGNSKCKMACQNSTSNLETSTYLPVAMKTNVSYYLVPRGSSQNELCGHANIEHKEAKRQSPLISPAKHSQEEPIEIIFISTDDKVSHDTAAIQSPKYSNCTDENKPPVIKIEFDSHVDSSDILKCIDQKITLDKFNNKLKSPSSEEACNQVFKLQCKTGAILCGNNSFEKDVIPELDNSKILNKELISTPEQTSLQCDSSHPGNDRNVNEENVLNNEHGNKTIIMHKKNNASNVMNSAIQKLIRSFCSEISKERTQQT